MHVELVFVLPGKVSCWHTHRPDADNLLKSTLDALAESGIWHDDAQVASLQVSKFKDHRSRMGCHITLEQAPSFF